MKVQISSKRMLKDGLCVWHELLPDTDIVVDPRPPYGLKMQPGSIKSLYVFDVLGITDTKYHQDMVNGWMNLLTLGGTLYIIENDFDHISRAIVGGDLPIDDFNKEFNQKCQVNKDLVVGLLIKAGCPQGTQREWSHDGLKFTVPAYKFILSADKK